MWMDKVNPLNPLISKLQKLNYAEDSAKRWEHSRVSWTINQLTLQSYMKRFQKENPGELLNFEWFNLDNHLPIYLACVHDLGKQPLHRNQKAIQPNWFLKFPTLPFMSHYNKLLENLPSTETRTVGLIFPRKGFGQGLILHNGDINDYVPHDTGFHVYRTKENATTDFLIVQPYSSLIAKLKSGF